ncbi:aspartate-glutamate racemase family [Perilla frutescens var. frutescens]|nr:aspartate-glutamate racemase family [Perilla frutescens var. frutescens]
MSLCFQPFNYASNINCCVSKHTSQSQGKKNPSLVKIPIPFENPNPGEISSTSFFNKSSLVNGIGIIGGISTDSSLNFAKKLKKLQAAEEGSSLSLPFILCSDPALSKELSSFDRSSSPFFSAKNGRAAADCSSIVENLRRKRAFLEKSGVCCVVMPCHISHSWHDQIEEGCSVPFLHVGECVANELKEAKLRPLEAGSPLRIGVLATNEALVPAIYQQKLEKEGFEVVLLDKATVEHTVIPAVEALNRKDLEGAQNLFKIALQVLLVRAVNRVILASDYLDQLLPPEDPLWRKCIDPMDALARSSIKYARSAGTGK